jgi:hypothetical protein
LENRLTANYNISKLTKEPRKGEIVTSDKQNRANRRNARKSTGPKTPEGKAAARHNALKHGLLSQEILLRGEDGEALRALGESLRDELRPVGELENLLVDRIIAACWRLRRVGRVEAGIFAWERYEELAQRAEREAQGYVWILPDDAGQPPNAHIVNQGSYDQALSRAQQMREEQQDETVTLGRTFARDADKANAFSKLSRYETTIERSLYKALHELQRLQSARGAGNHIPPPVAVDVDVSGISGEDV